MGVLVSKWLSIKCIGAPTATSWIRVVSVPSIVISQAMGRRYTHLNAWRTNFLWCQTKQHLKKTTLLRSTVADIYLLQGCFENISNRDGRPAPRCGERGARRPVKMIKSAGKLWGKIKAQISTFSNKGNKRWNNITTLNNAQSSLSIGYARESKKWKYLLIFFC